MPLPPSIVLHSSLRCLHMITFNHQVLPCQQQLRHYAGQNIKVASLCGGGGVYSGHCCYVMQR